MRLLPGRKPLNTSPCPVDLIVIPHPSYTRVHISKLVMIDTISSSEQLHSHDNSKEDLAAEMLSELGKPEYLEVGDDNHLKADVIMIASSLTIEFYPCSFHLTYLTQVGHVIVGYQMPVNAVRLNFPWRNK